MSDDIEKAAREWLESQWESTCDSEVQSLAALIREQVEKATRDMVKRGYATTEEGERITALEVELKLKDAALEKADEVLKHHPHSGEWYAATVAYREARGKTRTP